MTAMAAVAMGVAFTSCSHNTDLYGGEEGSGKINGRTAKEQIELDKAVYKAAFEQSFGKVAPTVDWGFGGYTRAMTRTITVNGDAYDKFPSAADVNSHFPTGIPTDADDLPTNGDYNYYYGKGAGHNYVIRSAGTYTIGGGWQNANWDGTVNKTVPQPYNVYVSVDGNDEVLIKHSGSAMHNLYILKGNVKLDSSVGEMANVVITVADGATLTDTRDHIAARTDLYGAIELYNKGTFYATNSTKYDMGNKARFYNEGTATITGPLSYSPADAENSFFINLGDDAVLTAPSMTLNSTGNFYNDGQVNITGETNVTQANIYWVNAGHYTTRTMTFSAKNTTFYNYCNLIVTGHANMYTGAFNLMDNSYTEVGSANLGKENFRINMGNNAGFNAKGNVKFESNADNTEQGFFATGTKAYVRIEGKAQVEKHKYVFVLDGNITYAIRDGVENLQPLDPYYTPYSEFRSGTTEVKAEDFAKFNATPNTNGCGATWSIDGGEPETYRVIAEDLSADQQSDFDFNDVVFDVDPDDDGYGATITIYAAGGIWPLKINGEEIHEKLIPGIQKFDYKDKKTGETYQCYPMINTEAAEHGESTSNRPTISVRTAEKVWDSDDNIRNSIRDYIHLIVYKYDDTDGEELIAKEGEAACKILVDKNYKVNSERNNIATGTKFKDYVSGKLIGRVWW